LVAKPHTLRRRGHATSVRFAKFAVVFLYDTDAEVASNMAAAVSRRRVAVNFEDRAVSLSYVGHSLPGSGGRVLQTAAAESLAPSGAAPSVPILAEPQSHARTRLRYCRPQLQLQVKDCNQSTRDQSGDSRVRANSNCAFDCGNKSSRRNGDGDRKLEEVEQPVQSREHRRCKPEVPKRHRDDKLNTATKQLPVTIEGVLGAGRTVTDLVVAALDSVDKKTRKSLPPAPLQPRAVSNSSSSSSSNNNNNNNNNNNCYKEYCWTETLRGTCDQRRHSVCAVRRDALRLSTDSERDRHSQLRKQGTNQKHEPFFLFFCACCAAGLIMTDCHGSIG
jgi:hypothetical protein